MFCFLNLWKSVSSNWLILQIVFHFVSQIVEKDDLIIVPVSFYILYPELVRRRSSFIGFFSVDTFMDSKVTYL